MRAVRNVLGKKEERKPFHNGKIDSFFHYALSLENRMRALFNLPVSLLQMFFISMRLYFERLCCERYLIRLTFNLEMYVASDAVDDVARTAIAFAAINHINGWVRFSTRNIIPHEQRTICATRNLKPQAHSIIRRHSNNRRRRTYRNENKKRFQSHSICVKSGYCMHCMFCWSRKSTVATGVRPSIVRGFTSIRRLSLLNFV